MLIRVIALHQQLHAMSPVITLTATLEHRQVHDYTDYKTMAHGKHAGI